MALSFAKKTHAANVAAQASAAASTPTQVSKTALAASNVVAPSWMKKGAEAKAYLAKEEAKAEERKAEAGKLWRFYVKPESEGQITFLDGALDAANDLDIFMFYEHRIRLNGEWENFICTAEADQSQPCPICESGDRSALVGVMTVIDHKAHVIQNGKNAGKTIQNTRKLFVAKRHTIDLLRKLAVKRGGLAGCTFDVMRGNEKSPSVGENFDFVQKFTNLGEIVAKYEMKPEDVQPANYGEEIRFRTPEELIVLGAGKAVATHAGATKAASKSLSDEL